MPNSEEAQYFEMLRDLPLSLIIGYGVPTVLMSIPFKHNLLHQWLGAFWQGHPLLILLTLRLHRAFRTKAVERTEVPNGQQNHRSLSKVRNRVYLFAIATSAITHIASLSIVAAQELFPMLFSQWAHETINLKEVYQPPPPLLIVNVPMKSMALAILQFFQYDLYCGSAASIFWALITYLRSRQAPFFMTDTLLLAFKAIGLCIIAGPSAVLVLLMYSRDEEIGRANLTKGGKDS